MSASTSLGATRASVVVIVSIRFSIGTKEMIASRNSRAGKSARKK